MPTLRHAATWIRRIGALTLISLAPALGLAACAIVAQPRPTERRETATEAPAADGPPFRLPAGYEIPPPTNPLTPAEVVTVIDGDTIHVRIDGEIHSVRYVGINATEVSGDDPPQSLGVRATVANRQLVEGRTVYLERDTSETDQHDRLLRYVWVEGGLVNAELVRAGMAFAKRYPPDDRLHDELVALQNLARAAQVGMWAAGPASSDRVDGSDIHIVSLSGRSLPEYVEICNAGERDQPMAGWRLRSVRGGEGYRFPDDYDLRAGTCVRVLSGEGAQESRPNHLLWGPDTVWSNREPDPAELYDAEGSLVDRRSEG